MWSLEGAVLAALLLGLPIAILVTDRLNAWKCPWDQRPNALDCTIRRMGGQDPITIQWQLRRAEENRRNRERMGAYRNG